MSQHLKSRVIRLLNGAVAYYVPPSHVAASHARGVRYLVPITYINIFFGAMNSARQGRQYRKHIIVRRVHRHDGQFLQLYTYHFPKTWSAACVANRELIKTAQRRAHALEHDCSLAAIEWRIRFFHHYFRVFKGGAKPEPGMKPYSRFYQYTYVAIYRQLKAAQQAALQPAIPPTAEDVTFSPIEPNVSRHQYPIFNLHSPIFYPQSPPPCLRILS